MVALRKESVDRNSHLRYVCRMEPLSLSARRAWIEIETLSSVVSCPLVALRKESVDRNSATRISKKVKNTSLSARRAWIEIRIPVLLL